MVELTSGTHRYAERTSAVCSSSLLKLLKGLSMPHVDATRIPLMQRSHLGMLADADACYL